MLYLFLNSNDYYYRYSLVMSNDGNKMQNVITRESHFSQHMCYICIILWYSNIFYGVTIAKYILNVNKKGLQETKTHCHYFIWNVWLHT